MSANANIVFFGIRIALSEEEAAVFDRRKHPLVVRARDAGLSSYMANFGGSEPLYFLFIGKPLGITGPEDQDEVITTASNLEKTVTLVRNLLVQIGIAEEPSLFTQWLPDA